MHKKSKPIPVNAMADGLEEGIAIAKLAFTGLHNLDNGVLNTFEEAKQSHRHDSHSFFLLEEGTIFIEIDFQRYNINAPSVIYVHPDQVHRTMAFENVTVSSLSITADNLNTEYLQLLENITPTKPLVLQKEMFSVVSEAISLCIKFAERKKDQLYHPALKDCCNALAALVISFYLEAVKPENKPSRFEMVTKAFKKILERDYSTNKRPAAYARKLNISTSYLNECVKNTTGKPVSYAIQQRIILEAKRLLCYSNKSVKEIAAELGYDDYPYFSRLFTKTTGKTPLAFRNKNHG